MSYSPNVLIVANYPTYVDLVSNKLVRDGIPFRNILSWATQSEKNSKPDSIKEYSKNFGIDYLIFNQREKHFLRMVDEFKNSSKTVMGLGTASHLYTTDLNLMFNNMDIMKIAHPYFKVCEDRRRARIAAEAIGFPLVIKSAVREAGAKWGFVCKNEASFNQAIIALLEWEIWDGNPKKQQSRCTIQPYIEGQSSSLVILFHNNQYRIISGCTERDTEIKEQVLNPLVSMYKILQLNLSAFLKINIVKTHKEISIVDINPFFKIEEMEVMFRDMQSPLLPLIPDVEVTPKGKECVVSVA